VSDEEGCSEGLGRAWSPPLVLIHAGKAVYGLVCVTECNDDVFYGFACGKGHFGRFEQFMHGLNVFNLIQSP
jgi:hypothetical protein